MSRMINELVTGKIYHKLKANPIALLGSLLLVICLFTFLHGGLYRQIAPESPRSDKHSTSENEKVMSLTSKHASALTVNFPLHLFSANEPANWRTQAVYDASLAREHEQDKQWKSYSHAQDAEDLWLYENWFYGMKNGVILESGALDGQTFSTSYMFENKANWTSVHVEADPINYGKLIQNRLNAININCALCSEPRLLHYTVHGRDSSVVSAVRGFVELMPPAFIQQWYPKISSGEVKIEDLPAVQCVTAKSLLKELHLRHIDIWILDVEGAEESVLKGTDFGKVRINAIAMECDEHDIPKNKRKTDIIEGHGFECTLVQRNCMCRNLLHKISAAPQSVQVKRMMRGESLG